MFSALLSKKRDYVFCLRYLLNFVRLFHENVDFIKISMSYWKYRWDARLDKMQCLKNKNPNENRGVLAILSIVECESNIFKFEY